MFVLFLGGCCVLILGVGYLDDVGFYLVQVIEIRRFILYVFFLSFHVFNIW